MCRNDFGVCELCEIEFKEVPENYGYGYVCVSCALRMQQTGEDFNELKQEYEALEKGMNELDNSIMDLYTGISDDEK